MVHVVSSRELDPGHYDNRTGYDLAAKFQADFLRVLKHYLEMSNMADTSAHDQLRGATNPMMMLATMIVLPALGHRDDSAERTRKIIEFVMNVAVDLSAGVEEMWPKLEEIMKKEGIKQ